MTYLSSYVSYGFSGIFFDARVLNSGLSRFLIDYLVMVKDKNARVLMQEICWFCQKPLDYDKWIQGSKDDEFGIAYAVPFTRTWMPFFIVKRNVVPDYDERFNLYGYDRLVHVSL